MSDSTSKVKRTIKSLIDFFLPAIIIFCIVSVINRFILGLAYVPTCSMQNTIQPQELTIGLRIHGDKKAELSRGDIIVFETEEYMVGEKTDENQYYVKRIIGLPGDTVAIVNGDTIINGEKFDDEQWIAEKPDQDMEEITVPANSYFVMGDNRNNSFDSRFWTNHFVPAENVISRVFMIGTKLI